MSEAIESTAGGIKCDTQNCDYKDMNVLVEDYPLWVNRPCPKCKSNLLTEEDFTAHGKLMASVSVVNSLAKILGVDKASGNDKSIKVRVSYDGTGKAKFEEV